MIFLSSCSFNGNARWKLQQRNCRWERPTCRTRRWLWTTRAKHCLNKRNAEFICRKKNHQTKRKKKNIKKKVDTKRFLFWTVQNKDLTKKKYETIELFFLLLRKRIIRWISHVRIKQQCMIRESDEIYSVFFFSTNPRCLYSIERNGR